MTNEVLNLMREFEYARMKQSEIFKECSDTLLCIFNKVKLQDTEFKDTRSVEKKFFLQFPKDMKYV